MAKSCAPNAGAQLPSRSGKQIPHAATKSWHTTTKSLHSQIQFFCKERRLKKKAEYSLKQT